MFYIYSPRGRVFSGPLEMLRKVEASNRTAKGQVRQEFMLQQEIEASVSQGSEGTEGGPGHEAPGQSYSAPAESISKYKQILKSQGQPEPVFHVHQVMSFVA